VPKYVSSLDIHCMPGSYTRAVAPDDVAVGAVYDRGAHLYCIGYCGPDNDDMGRSVGNFIRRNLKGFAPRRWAVT
jgi:hypothetical protein